MFEIDKEQFGALVSQLRKEKGLTQKEVAQQLLYLIRLSVNGNEV